MKFELNYVKGVEGNSIYLNEYRIAGPKPWGGGAALKTWIIESDVIARALRIDEKLILDNAKTWHEEHPHLLKQEAE